VRCPGCLLGFLRGGCICGQVRVFQFVAAPPQNPERPESVSELSPDCLFDGVVAAAGRRAQPLLREQGDAGEPRSFIGQDVGAVRSIEDQPGRGGRRLRLPEQRGPVSRRGSGRIVNVSSIIGEIGNIGQANYAASKSGLFGLTKTLAKEVAFMLERAGKLTDDGLAVTVNTVTPGFIATEMVEAVPEKVIDKIKGQIPMRRLGRPEEVARVVHFLAADASSYITGQVWGVNGGMDM
jgi:NAD(P)-dependent dehydrogenase (short-subunit alcohol dehydrogenase family)